MKPASEMHLDTTILPTSRVGIAAYPDSGRTLDELIAFADAAMYRSKRAGKNCFCLHGELQTICISPTRMGKHKV